MTISDFLNRIRLLNMEMETAYANNNLEELDKAFTCYYDAHNQLNGTLDVSLGDMMEAMDSAYRMPMITGKYVKLDIGLSLTELSSDSSIYGSYSDPLFVILSSMMKFMHAVRLSHPYENFTEEYRAKVFSVVYDTIFQLLRLLSYRIVIDSIDKSAASPEKYKKYMNVIERKIRMAVKTQTGQYHPVDDAYTQAFHDAWYSNLSVELDVLRRKHELHINIVSNYDIILDPKEEGSKYV